MIPTELHTIETYAELNRLLAGRIDIVEFVDKIKRSFAEKRMQTIYNILQRNKRTSCSFWSNWLLCGG